MSKDIKILIPEIKSSGNSFLRITSPLTKLTGRAKFAYLKLYDDFAQEYNKDKDLKSQLRGAHRELYFILLEKLRTQIYNDNIALKRSAKNHQRAISPSTPYPFNTNSAWIQATIDMNSKKTAYNRLNRLIEAGIVEKEGHGAYRNFTLFINPDLVLIWDKDNPAHDPIAHISSKSLSVENQADVKSNKVNFTNVSVYSDNTSNKKINDVHKVAGYGILLPSNNSFKNTDAIYRYTPKQGENSDKPQSITTKSEEKSEKKEKSSAKKEKNGWSGSRWTKAWWVELWVKQFYGLMVEWLFKNHDIWDFEKERTMDLLRNHFAQMQSVAQGVRFMAQLRWRLMAASRWVSAKNYDISNVYPYAYLTQTDTKKFNFKVTSKWWSKHLNYIIDRDERNKKREKYYVAQQKLQKATTAYLKSPTLTQFRNQENYILQNIPEYLAQFYAGIGIDVEKNSTEAQEAA